MVIYNRNLREKKKESTRCMWLTSPLLTDDDLDIIRAASSRQRAEEQGSGQLIAWIHETTTRRMLWVQGKLYACLCVFTATDNHNIDINKEYSRSDREVFCERKKKKQTQGTVSCRISSKHQNTESTCLLSRWTFQGQLTVRCGSCGNNIFWVTPKGGQHLCHAGFQTTKAAENNKGKLHPNNSH